MNRLSGTLTLSLYEERVNEGEPKVGSLCSVIGLC